MSDFARINGAAVRTTASYRRRQEQPNGATLSELEIVVIVRGTMAHRSFLQLIAREPIVVEMPEGEGWISFDAVVASATHASSGTGEAAAYRHDVVFRETSDSAERRAATAADALASVPAEPEPEEIEVEADEASYDLANVRVSGDESVWRTALSQFAAPVAKPPAPEPPLTGEQLIGIEAVLVNLKMEALIDEMASAGLIRRSQVERAFHFLVRERLVQEAAPIVGEAIAKRALREFESGSGS